MPSTNMHANATGGHLHLWFVHDRHALPALRGRLLREEAGGQGRHVRAQHAVQKCVLHCLSHIMQSTSSIPPLVSLRPHAWETMPPLHPVHNLPCANPSLALCMCPCCAEWWPVEEHGEFPTLGGDPFNLKPVEPRPFRKCSTSPNSTIISLPRHPIHATIIYLPCHQLELHCHSRV
jgi:hypothetical protein